MSAPADAFEPGIVTRFAPSPTGRLHLGHAHAALFAARAAAAAGGRFLLRIEDIDQGRCRPEFEAGIFEDLSFLGLTWKEPVRRQSVHMAEYAAAVAALQQMHLLYPCFCTRKEIAAELAGAASAPHAPIAAAVRNVGEDIAAAGEAPPPFDAPPPYPGTCRVLPREIGAQRMARGEPFALRLHMERAVDRALADVGHLRFTDRRFGTITATPERFGDIVLARKETPTSYHLAVTLDDARQGVTLVTRGEDLFHATHIHRLLQALFGLPEPLWHHHGLIRDDAGFRLAKRTGAPTIASLRAAGRIAAEIRALAGFPD